MKKQTSKRRYRTKEAFVYEYLHDAILTCQRAPGDKLVMDQLSEELEVSPIPIRSALQRLAAEGLITITPHTGATVSAISHESVTEIFTLLETLEQTSFQLAGERLTHRELNELASIVHNMDDAIAAEDLNAWAYHNTDFHRAVARLSGMKLLADFVERVLTHWLRLSHCYFGDDAPARMLRAQDEHHQMLMLFARKDIDALKSLAIRHNRQAYQAYVSKLNQSKSS